MSRLGVLSPTPDRENECRPERGGTFSSDEHQRSSRTGDPYLVRVAFVNGEE
jgi:hypothetical protein